MGKGSKKKPQATPKPKRDRPQRRVVLETEDDFLTPERKAKGEWSWIAVEKNGPKAPRDLHAHPVDRLQHSGQISPDQASAAYDYEQLYRAALQVPQARDSCTLWEPKGHDNDDGNVEAVRRYRDFCRSVGMIRERQMQWVCVEMNHPEREEIGAFREALNEAERFFGYAKKK